MPLGPFRALLVLAAGCRREGLFNAIGALLAVRARGSARRMSRGGDRSRPGPKSVGHAARFVLDHVTCQVLLV